MHTTSKKGSNPGNTTSNVKTGYDPQVFRIA